MTAGGGGAWLVAVTLALVAVTACTESLSAGVDPEEVAERVEDLETCVASAPTELVVWMGVQPDPAEVERAREVLSESVGSGTLTYVDSEQAYAEFVEFYADEDEVLEAVAPGQLPALFRASGLTDAELAATDAAAQAAGLDVDEGAGPRRCEDEVAALEASCDGAPIESLTIWMDVGVEPATVDELAVWLADQPLMSEARYLDTDETYERFVEFYGDDSATLDLVEPEQIPTSFIAPLPDETDPREVTSVVEQIEAMPGVDEVDTQLTPELAVCGVTFE